MTNENPDFNTNTYLIRENRVKINKRSYEMKKRKDLFEIRNKKLKELYENEKDTMELELLAKNRKVSGTRNKFDEPKLEKKIKNFENAEPQNLSHAPIIEPLKVASIPSARTDRIKNQNYKVDNNLNFSIEHTPETTITRVNNELDKTIKKYNENLDKLKLEDFMSRKKMQDDLLSKINIQMEKLKFGLNDKCYEEEIAQIWLKEYQDKMEQSKEGQTHIKIKMDRNKLNNY